MPQWEASVRGYDIMLALFLVLHVPHNFSLLCITNRSTNPVHEINLLTALAEPACEMGVCGTVGGIP